MSGTTWSAEEVAWMRRALELAERARGRTSPNPLVGCVLVRDGAVVGEGFHARAGEAHAEVAALRAAAGQARGATAFVTLEPCAHTGRTGPCADALLDAGVAEVVAALADPNPAAAGGAERLRGAGVPVRVGLLADEAARQNEVFLHAVATARPFVVAKAAVSLDGRIAAADGTSQWLTGEGARGRAHALRAEVDAVLVGVGTVLADDPQLTCRLPAYDGPQPLRVVLDSTARTTPGHRVCDGAAPTLVLATDAAGDASHLRTAGVDVAVLPGGTGGVDLDAAFGTLWDRGVRSVLAEGGGSVVGSLVRSGLVDKLVVHVAPVLLGEKGRPLLAGDGIATLGDAPRLRLAHAEHVGGDAVLTLYPDPARRPTRHVAEER